MNVKKIEKKLLNSIFTKGSTTYSHSSLFFSKKMYADIEIFYSYLRIIDNLVDLVPKQYEAFFYLKEKFYRRIDGDKNVPMIIEKICTLIEEKDIPVEYITAFLYSMECDLRDEYIVNTMEECNTYMYGSAAIIGVIMCKLCNISSEAYDYANLLGKCMQYVNFIRDIEEDYSKKRQYIPLLHTSLVNLGKQEALEKPIEFQRFIRSNIELYYAWLEEAVKGFQYIPRKVLIPIYTAMQGYHYIAKKIHKNPFSIYSKKIKPKKIYILGKGLINCFMMSRTRI